jgi:hypothetical protein
MSMRKAVRSLLVAAAALLSTAAPAAASTITLGPPNLAGYSDDMGGGTETALNLTDGASNSYAAPSDGTVTSYSFRANSCSVACSSRLLVMRHVSGTTYDVIETSAPNLGPTGLQTFSTDLDVLQGDLLAIDVSSGGIKGTNAPGATNVGRTGTVGGTPYTFDDAWPGMLFLYDVEFEASVPTSVSVDRPNSANAGDPVAYVAHVERNTGTDRSMIGGTISFNQDGVPIAACQSLPVTAGDATCSTTVSPVAGRHSIQVSYSGDSPFQSTTGSGSMNVRQATTTSVTTQDVGPFDPSGPITFTATVTPPPSASFVVSAGVLQQLLDRGKAAFSVDGVAVEACSARPVDAVTGLATCATTAPADGRDHVVTAAYSGGTFYLASAGDGPFKLKVPDAPVPPPVAPPTPTVPVTTTTTPPPTGAVFAPGEPTTLPASTTGTPSVTVPVRCPDGNACDIQGTVTVATSTKPGTARVAQAATATVARFSRVHVAGGKVKKLKLRLDAAFVRKAQKQGVRRVKATLTIVTTLGSGQKLTTHQKLTIVLPKAKQKVAPAPHFTG